MQVFIYISYFNETNISHVLANSVIQTVLDNFKWVIDTIEQITQRIIDLSHKGTNRPPHLILDPEPLEP